MTELEDRHGLRVVVGLCAAAVVAFLVLPGGSIWQIGAWLTPMLLAAGLLVARTARSASTERGPLLLLLGGHLLYLGVSAVWYVGPLSLGLAFPFPSPVDGVHLVSHIVTCAFLLVLLRRRLRGRVAGNRVALIDSSILTVSMATLLWVLVIEPQLTGGSSAAATTMAVIFPLSSLALFGLVAHLGLTAGSTARTPIMLLLWVAAEVVADLWYGIAATNGTFAYDNPMMVGWMVSSAALATFAAHPRFRDLLGERAHGRPEESIPRSAATRSGTSVRLALLLFAALIPLVLDAVHWHPGGLSMEEFVLPAASAAMFALVTYRTALLAGDLDKQSRLTADLDGAVERLRNQRDQLARYGAIVDSIDDAVVVVSLDGCIVDWNRGAERIYGFAHDEAVGQPLSTVVSPVDPDLVADTVGRAMALGHASVEALERRKDGSTVETSVNVSSVRNEAGTVIALVGICRDISALKAREAAQQQDSKLESLGRLSAGLAHEINSPIQFVGDNARFLAEAYQDLIGAVLFYRGLLDSANPMSWIERLAKMEEAEAGIEFEYLQTEIPSAVAQTLEGIERVSTIVRAMKTFSHPGHKEQVPADLNEALEATVTVTRHQVNGVADLTIDLGDLPPVRCNIADLNQVFLNLIVNAADAVEETGTRGHIRVTTAADDEEVVVRISDTGGGIPEHVRCKIFDPFFTTKDVGRGTGQGLPLARAVVHEGHGGTLTVESTPGAGSTFTVRLPIHGRVAAEAEPEAVPV